MTVHTQCNPTKNPPTLSGIKSVVRALYIGSHVYSAHILTHPQVKLPPIAIYIRECGGVSAGTNTSRDHDLGQTAHLCSVWTGILTTKVSHTKMAPFSSKVGYSAR
jgi:hypothetical protein